MADDGEDGAVGNAGERLARLGRDESLAPIVGFVWGFAEGTFFFIVPDVGIAFATLFSLRAGAWAWGASIAGSLVAVSVLWGGAAVLGLDLLALLDAVPAIAPALIADVSTRVAAEGLPWTPLLFLGGVPLKLYASAAFVAGTSLAAVLGWTVFARVVRIAPTFLVVGGLRLALGRHIDRRPVAWTGALLTFWTVFYAFYFVRMGG